MYGARYINWLRNSINRLRAKQDLKHFHQVHKKAAFDVIAKAEKLNNIKLSPKIIKLADEYATEVFGDQVYAPWLYFYGLMRRKFEEGWIPQNFYTRYVLPDRGLVGVSGNKTFSNLIFKTEAFPDIAYYIDGIFYDREFSIISISTLQKMISANHDYVFAKINNSLEGKGIHKIEIKNLTKDQFAHVGNCVIQVPIQQHSFFDNIIKGPVATTRIVTVRKPTGGIDYRTAYLKLGRTEHDWFTSIDCIMVPVINEIGELNSHGFTQDFQRVNQHPDTEAVFNKLKIPQFAQAVTMCMAFHKSIPHFPIIGWDIAIDLEENVKFLEWNAGIPHPSIQFSQATTGPCFKGLNWEQLGNT